MVALDVNGLSTTNYLQETFHGKDKQHIFCLKLLKTSFLPFKRKALSSKIKIPAAKYYSNAIPVIGSTF